jgi:hypothetical protein
MRKQVQTLISRMRLSNWEMVVGSSAFLSLFVLLTAEPGCVSKTEFSPDSLAFRSRDYVCYPFLEIDSEWEPPLVARIREFDDGLVPQTSPPRWHFVHGDKWRTRGWIGDAKPAYRLFRNEDWLQWTDQNPDLAKKLWPKIIHMLRQERYGPVTVALMFARDAKTIQDIDHAIAEAEKE